MVVRVRHEYGHGEHEAEEDTDASFAPHDPAEVTEADLAHGHGADEGGRGLGARAAAGVDEQRRSSVCSRSWRSERHDVSFECPAQSGEE